MKRIRLLLGIALAAFAVGTLAQPVNRVTGPAVLDIGGASKVNTEGERVTYSAIATGLVPAAAATDVFCIAGAATKTIKVNTIEVSGTAGTLVTLPVFLAKRATADSGGTPAAGNALPVAAKMDTNSAASAATLISYTANPTINDTSPTLMRASTVTLPTTAAGTVASITRWTFGTTNGQALVIRGAAQQACINLSGITVTAGLMNVSIEWVEE